MKLILVFASLVLLNSVTALALPTGGMSEDKYSVQQDGSLIRIAQNKKTAYLKKCDSGFKLYKYPSALAGSAGINNYICLKQLYVCSTAWGAYPGVDQCNGKALICNNNKGWRWIDHTDSKDACFMNVHRPLLLECDRGILEQNIKGEYVCSTAPSKSTKHVK